MAGSEGDGPQVLPEGPHDRTLLRETIREQLGALESENSAAISPVDPDARPIWGGP